MTSLTGFEVEALSPDAAPEAGELLAASHADYPAFEYVVPDPERRRRFLRSFMTTTAKDAARFSEPLVARDDEGLIGVALWMTPGSFPQSAFRKAAMTPALLRVAMILGHRFPTFARVGPALERTHPGDRSWYLQAMGVHPRAQRWGVGKALIEPVLVIADEEGLPIHLHTSDPANIAYYQRYDFSVTDPSISVFPDGPTYTAMSRRPL